MPCYSVGNLNSGEWVSGALARMPTVSKECMDKLHDEVRAAFNEFANKGKKEDQKETIPFPAEYLDGEKLLCSVLNKHSVDPSLIAKGIEIVVLLDPRLNGAPIDVSFCKDRTEDLAQLFSMVHNEKTLGAIKNCIVNPCPIIEQVEAHYPQSEVILDRAKFIKGVFNRTIFKPKAIESIVPLTLNSLPALIIQQGAIAGHTLSPSQGGIFLKEPGEIIAQYARTHSPTFPPNRAAWCKAIEALRQTMEDPQRLILPTASGFGNVLLYNASHPHTPETLTYSLHQWRHHGQHQELYACGLGVHEVFPELRVWLHMGTPAVKQLLDAVGHWYDSEGDDKLIKNALREVRKACPFALDETPLSTWTCRERYEVGDKDECLIDYIKKAKTIIEETAKAVPQCIDPTLRFIVETVANDSWLEKNTNEACSILPTLSTWVKGWLADPTAILEKEHLEALTYIEKRSAQKLDSLHFHEQVELQNSDALRHLQDYLKLTFNVIQESTACPWKATGFFQHIAEVAKYTAENAVALQEQFEKDGFPYLARSTLSAPLPAAVLRLMSPRKAETPIEARYRDEWFRF